MSRNVVSCARVEDRLASVMPVWMCLMCRRRRELLGPTGPTALTGTCLQTTGAVGAGGKSLTRERQLRPESRGQDGAA